MGTEYFCGNENRRDKVRETVGAGNKPVLNGMDYLEVTSPDQKTLEVHFIHPLPGESGGVPASPKLKKTNFEISGGERITEIKIKDAVVSGNVVTLTVDEAGDFSTYTLHLVSGTEKETPPDKFDPQLAVLDFSFKVDCPSDFDCQPDDECPPDKLPAPLIDYMAKDYSSFRRLMLDRMATIMPDWKERNPADLGLALVETVAYAADQLSYYQDAVATEAYLGTARQRISVRRHARLLDYAMHDGCNARAWVCFEVEQGGSADGLALEAGQMLLTRGLKDTPTITSADLKEIFRHENPVIFETLTKVKLNSAHNSIRFYPWDDSECCLPRGATRATLYNDPKTSLNEGDVVILEEVISPETGLAADADLAHRHAVRLTSVEDSGVDPLNSIPIVEIAWDVEDALPFPLCISALVKEETGDHLIDDLSLARGNVVLADHGMTIRDEELEAFVPDATGNLPRPRLFYRPVTQQGHARDRFDKPVVDQLSGEPLVFDPQAPATRAMQWQMGDALPAAFLVENGDITRPWIPHHDLLNSTRFDRHFVLETENDNTARLRFGDGYLGAIPQPDSGFKVTYRVGNGANGNVGAESLARLVLAGGGVTRVRNPLPAQGGAEPESLEQVRQYAPQAFRTQERAVTVDDYARMAERHPEVQKAAATLRWTGSWYTVFITVDRAGGRAVDAEFETELRAFLEPFRLAGQDLEIDAPRFVSLDLAFTVCVAAGYDRNQVKAELLKLFSNRDLPNGQRGFFHPDNFTFGQPVYLSQMIALIMQVPGVKWVDAEDAPGKPNRFRRWGKSADGEFAAGKIEFARLEIARLDNDRSLPENGRFDFFMEGGM